MPITHVIACADLLCPDSNTACQSRETFAKSRKVNWIMFQKELYVSLLPTALLISTKRHVLHIKWCVVPFRLLLNWRNVCLLFKIMHDYDELWPAGPFSITALSGGCTRSFASNKLRLIQAKKSVNKFCFIVCSITQ